jgi:hypothetical protein
VQKIQNTKVTKCQNNTKSKFQIPNSKTLGNPKSKAQNPKQYQNSNFQNSKQKLCFGH